MANQLYEYKMKVLRGEGCDLPEDSKGAFVVCYAAAPDYQAAIKKGVAAMARMHFVFNDIQGKVREIPASFWKEYVQKVWPEFVERFPIQEELPYLIAHGVVFWGPFAAF